MSYFRGVLIGLVAVLLGCLVWLFGMMLWSGVGPQHAAGPVSFSPLGLAQHTAHSLGFWAFLVVLFVAGFAPFAFARKK